MGKFEKLEQLQKLKDSGSLTEEEFNKEKEKLLNKSVSNNKKAKVIIAILIVIVLLVGGGIGIYYIINNKTMTTSSSVNKDNKEEQGFKQESGNIQANGTETVSFRNMKVEDEKFNEIQKEILNYFDNDYLDFYFKNAQQYPQVFKGAKVTTTVAVVKVLKSTNEEFEVLGIDCGKTGYNYYKDVNLEDIPVEQLLIIKGNQLNERLVTGDTFVFFGRYEDVENRDIDGKSYMVSNLKATNIVKYVFPEEPQKYSYDTIKDVAEYIFGKDVKISQDNGDNFYYKVVLDNQSNVNFKAFDMGRYQGIIKYNVKENNLSSNIQKHLFVSADFQHYIVTTYDQNTKHVYIDYFDRELKKIWSREFDYASTKAFISPMDYTSDKMAAVIDNDLYLINLENGKDIIEPVIVGEKVKVNMMEDGIILIGDNNKDTIMKVDYTGKIVFRDNAQTKMTEIIGANTQIVNGKMVIHLIGTNNSPYEKFIVLNNDGTIEIKSEDLETD